MDRKAVILGLILVMVSLSGCQPKTSKTDQSSLPASTASTTVRQPAVAGQFYPSDAAELKQQINQLLDKPPDTQTPVPAILIVPHAGYTYSGQVAAYAYKTLLNHKYKRVVLLGSSHSARFAGAAVFNQGFWQTPLGQTPVDHQLAQTIINSDAQIIARQDHHQTEHSLEVQLPFLQTVLTDFQIIPILLGQTTEALLAKLATVLYQHLDNSTLIIISTDLSHYPSYDIANQVDKKTIDSMLTANLDHFNQTFDNQMAQAHPGLSTLSCAADAVRVSLLLADKLKFSDIKLLNYANSGDITNTKDHIVGYASLGFFQPQNMFKQAASRQLTSAEKQTLLRLARQTIIAHLSRTAQPSLTNSTGLLSLPLGAFVTLKKNDQLRGCMGEFEPLDPLWQVIQRTAITSATKDPRFPPIKSSDLNDITIEISILSPRQKIDHWQEIKLGTHGVVIQKDSRSGTFLPQVAVDTGWSLEEFLSQLCSQKAGLPQDCYQQPGTDFYIFTAQVFSE